MPPGPDEEHAQSMGVDIIGGCTRLTGQGLVAWLAMAEVTE
jgi:hypothetical protein